MVWKILAVGSLVLLPLSISLWRTSHVRPNVYRCDLTEFKSLRVSLRNGTCGLRLLTMPTKTNLDSKSRASLSYDPTPNGRSFLISSAWRGPYRITWLVFPLWLSTGVLTVLGAMPIVRGPVRRWWRRRRGLCVECAYDLRGSRGRRCSECGTRY